MAFVGINLVIGVMWTSLSAVSQLIVTKTGVQLDAVDVGWPVAASIAFLPPGEGGTITDALIKILRTAIDLAAVLLLMPRMVAILMEGLMTISEAAHEFMAQRFQGREIHLGLDAAVLIGHPSTLATSLLLIPITILLAIILPGNRMMPFADFAALPFFVALLVPITRGNVVRMLILGTLGAVAGLYMATWMAPMQIKAAKATGIVNIKVQFPWGRDRSQEAELIERYSLKAARVLRGDRFPYEETLKGIGSIGAEYLHEQLREGMILAISRGAAMHALVEELKPRRDLSITTVQMQGGLGDHSQSDIEFSNRLYSIFGASYRPLNAPSVMAGPYACAILRREPSITAVLNCIGKADIAIFGIGSTAEQVSGILHTGLVGPDELAQMRRAGIVGDIAGRLSTRTEAWCTRSMIESSAATRTPFCRYPTGSVSPAVR